jgi:hypothetical protein
MPRLRAPLALGLLPFVLFAPLTLLQRVFSAYDVQGYFFPYHVLPARMLLHGELPLWNPFVFSGIPLIGDGQTAVFYPTNWLFLLLPAPAALNYAVLLQFSLAGLCTYVFARSLGLWRLPAFVAAVSFMFCGFMSARVVHLSMMSGAALIPLILFCVDRLIQSRSPRWLALAALPVAAQALAGHPQIPVYSTIGVALYAIVRGVEHASLLRSALLVAGAYLLGGALAAVQLAPWAEAARFSVRAAGADYTWVFGTSTTGAEWLMFLFPFILGAHPASAFTSGSWGVYEASRAWEHSAYVGILPLALAFAACWHFVELSRGSRPNDRSRWYTLLFLVLLLATGVILAAGWHTPFRAIIYHTPLLGSFRAVERGMVLGSLALTLLAGFGLQRIIESPQPKRWLLWLAMLIVIVPAFFIWPAQAYRWRLHELFGISPYDLARLSIASPVAYVPMLLALATALLLAWWSRRPGGTLTQAIAVTLVVIDLGIYAIAFNATADRGLYEYHPQVLRVLHSDDGEPFRKATFLRVEDDISDRAGQELLALSWGMVHGVEDINGFNSLQSRRYTDYVFGPRTNDVSYGYLQDPHLLRADNTVLNSLNVRYLLLPTTLKIEPGPQFRPIVEDEHVRVYENMQAWPRAWFVERVSRQLDPHEVFEQVKATGFDGRRQAVVESADLPAVEPSTSPTKAIAARTSPNELRVTTNTTEQRFLVVSEMFYPGWRAYVDDAATPIFRTNYLFRGVVVPAGRHVVRFVYRPASIVVGTAVSSLTLILVAALLYLKATAPN